jgi:hypothetical protein
MISAGWLERWRRIQKRFVIVLVTRVPVRPTRYQREHHGAGPLTRRR